MMYLPSGEYVGAKSAKLSFVRLVTSFVARLTVKMSPTALRSAENATVWPSGENDGDSGSSTVVIGIRSSIFLVRTFWMSSARSLFVRTKYARRTPFGDH